jgi:hypothetical protein
MADIGQVGAAAVTTIGTVAIVGIAAKAVSKTAKHVGRMPGIKSNYRAMKGHVKRTTRRSKNFSIWK